MTIAVAIRTGSEVVFAADSKITTSGIVGFEQDGSPRLELQTYDHGTKIVQDLSGTAMVMAAGAVNVGQVSALDFLSMSDFAQLANLQTDKEREDYVQGTILSPLVEWKRAYWSTTQVPPASWPGPTLIIAAPNALSRTLQVWRADLTGETFACEPVLTEPFIYLEGSYRNVYALLYGLEPTVLDALGEQIGDRDGLYDAWQGFTGLRPIDKLNLFVMPTQDAIDLAVFLAKVQVEMDRFLPGKEACGGPIDVMVLRVSPRPGILVYAGKELHHPDRGIRRG